MLRVCQQLTQESVAAKDDGCKGKRKQRQERRTKSHPEIRTHVLVRCISLTLRKLYRFLGVDSIPCV